MTKMRGESARNLRMTWSNFRGSWETIISKSLLLAGKSLIFASSIKQFMLGEDRCKSVQENCGKKSLMNFRFPALAHLQVSH